MVLSKIKEYKQLQKQIRQQACTLSPLTSPIRQSSLILPSFFLAFATPPPRTFPPAENWANWAMLLIIRIRKKGVIYVKERIEAVMNGIPITLSVKYVQEKVKDIAERSILSGALAK